MSIKEIRQNNRYEHKVVNALVVPYELEILFKIMLLPEVIEMSYCIFCLAVTSIRHYLLLNIGSWVIHN